MSLQLPDRLIDHVLNSGLSNHGQPEQQIGNSKVVPTAFVNPPDGFMKYYFQYAFLKKSAK